MWWEATEEAIRESGQIISWEVFRTRFIQEYSPPSYYSAKEAEFNQLVQGNMSVGEYASQFSALLAYVPHVSNSDRFQDFEFYARTEPDDTYLVMTGAPTTYAEAVEKAKNIEAILLWGGPQQVPSFNSQGFGSSIQMPVGIPHQPPQSKQPPKQQKFRAKGNRFKKKSYSSSSSSGSSRGGRSSGYVRDSCGRCGGRHPTTQCTGVQGDFHTCGLSRHYARPSYQQPRGSAQQYFPGPQQARVHALTQDQVHETPRGVIADTGASHSFLSAAFIDEHEIATTLLLDTVSMSTPAGVYLMSREIVLNCVIRFDDNLVITNLIKLSMSDFDCILGMDTLTNYRATVDCFHGVVRFRPYYGNKWNFYGNNSQSRIPLVTAMEMVRLLSAGNEGFMIYAVDVTQEEMLKGLDIPMVKDLRDEIPGFPPQREIYFNIELMSGTNPISRAPYRLALAELKELKEQLRDLQEKGYIRPKCESSFQALKEKLTTTPVLALPSGSSGFVVCTDASLNGLGWRMNLVADALSRKAQNVMLTSLNIFKIHEHLGTSGWTYQTSGDYFIVSSIKLEPQIITSIKAAQRTDPHIHRLKEFAQTNQSHKFSVASYGSFRFNGRLVVPNLIDLKEAILREAHCSRHIIHLGNRKMYHTLRAHLGGKVKAERMRPGCMLNSLEVPQWNWEHIAMDFVTHLPRSNHGCDAI
ncbi:uncharacterized protein LOC142554662 [Primulina tabacum]|uniref:uncharacterized protein LOC142554662 n=1 Tax=Primulina tabacum TaxID=48773 RepID=UPI003F59207C